MPAIKKDQAILKLISMIQDCEVDEIAEVYNELFPEAPTGTSQVTANPGSFRKKILDHVDKGLEIEEIVDLWRLMFPNDRRIHFDEETNQLSYTEHAFLHAE